MGVIVASGIPSGAGQAGLAEAVLAQVLQAAQDVALPVALEGLGVDADRFQPHLVVDGLFALDAGVAVGLAGQAEVFDVRGVIGRRKSGGCQIFVLPSSMTARGARK